MKGEGGGSGDFDLFPKSTVFSSRSSIVTYSLPASLPPSDRYLLWLSLSLSHLLWCPWLIPGNPPMTQGDPWVTQDDPWVTQDDPWMTQDDPRMTPG